VWLAVLVDPAAYLLAPYRQGGSGPGLTREEASCLSPDPAASPHWHTAASGSWKALHNCRICAAGITAGYAPPQTCRIMTAQPPRTAVPRAGIYLSSRGWPTRSNARAAVRMFMHRRPRGERPHLPLPVRDVQARRSCRVEDVPLVHAYAQLDMMIRRPWLGLDLTVFPTDRAGGPGSHLNELIRRRHLQRLACWL
jgi:hypothetical protein